MTGRAFGRRRLVAAAGGAFAFASGAAEAGRALTLIVPAPAGSPSDHAARAFAPFLERHLPHAVVWVSNYAAGAGFAGFRAMAGAETSGQTVGWVSTPALTARSVDHPGAGDLLGAVRLVGAVAEEPIAFVSAAGSPLASAQDLIRRAAEDAAAVPLGTPAAGSAPHLAALRLQALARTPLNIVAFPSAAAARQAAQSGNVAAAALAFGEALEGLQAGRLAGLGVAAAHAPTAFPDIVPLRDSGLLLSASLRRGLAVPAGTADVQCERLATALRDVVDDPEFRAQAEADGFAPMWLDGLAWTGQAAREQTELAALWRDAPWDASALG